MADMTREQAHTALEKVGAAMRAQHADADPARLGQLDAHLATVGMVVDQLFDDAEKR